MTSHPKGKETAGNPMISGPLLDKIRRLLRIGKFMDVVYESPHFLLIAPERPHVSRQDGGHMILVPKRKVPNRWDMLPIEAIEFVRLTMVVGEAMMESLRIQGIPIERINFQDNGNWSIGSRRSQVFHLHFYGRAKGSRYQTHGEALVLPPKGSDYYEVLEPLSRDDTRVIRLMIAKLLTSAKYNIDAWCQRPPRKVA